MKTALVATVLFSALLPTAAHAQAMFRGGPAHDGVYAAEGPRQFHRVKWTFPTGNRVMSSPVMQGNRSVAGDAAIVGFDRQFGVGAIFSSPLVANGAIYLGSTDGNLYALE